LIEKLIEELSIIVERIGTEIQYLLKPTVYIAQKLKTYLIVFSHKLMKDTQMKEAKSIDDASMSDWDRAVRAVNNNPPTHYDYTIQPWDYMESILSEEAFHGYLVGNIIKYISRFPHKGGEADLEKAQRYLTKLMSVY